jgi:hypothetical protein
MPFKSEAQRRKFYAMAADGEISQATVDRWEDETPKGKKLPERVKKALLRIKRANETDKMPGGKADDKPSSAFDAKQMALGQKVEMEHTDNPALAKEIARDHLEEFGDYYTHLDKMEKKLEAAKEAAYRLGVQHAFNCLSL